MKTWYGQGIGNCTTCPLSISQGQCPGGERLWANKGYCLKNIKGLTGDIRECVPKEACLGTRDGKAFCDPRYGNKLVNGALEDSCCTHCNHGFSRSDDDMCVPGNPSFHAWIAVSLLVVMAGLGYLNYLGRKETVYLFPWILIVFRTTQEYAFTALNFTHVCSWGASFPFELAMFPMFTGLVDYLHEPASAIARFWSQLFFLSVYLIPLLGAAAWTEWKRRKFAGVLPTGEIEPKVLARRAVVAWVWIMLIPLLFISLGQITCSGDEVANYPTTKCGSASHIVAIILGFILLATVIYGCFRILREVRRVSVSTDENPASDEDYLKYAFIYGAFHVKATSAWALDLFVSVVVVVHRSFFGAAPTAGALLSTIALLPCFVYLFKVRPYRSLLTNITYAIALVLIVFAQWVRYLRTQCDSDYDSLITPRTATYGSGPLQFFSVICVILYVTVLALAIYAVRQSHADKGKIKYHAELDHYAAMDDDDDAPVTDLHGAPKTGDDENNQELGFSNHNDE